MCVSFPFPQSVPRSFGSPTIPRTLDPPYPSGWPRPARSICRSSDRTTSTSSSTQIAEHSPAPQGRWGKLTGWSVGRARRQILLAGPPVDRVVDYSVEASIRVQGLRGAPGLWEREVSNWTKQVRITHPSKLHRKQSMEKGIPRPRINTAKYGLAAVKQSKCIHRCSQRAQSTRSSVKDVVSASSLLAGCQISFIRLHQTSLF